MVRGRVDDGTLHCGPGEFRVQDEADAARVQVLVCPEDVVHDDASPFKAEITSRTFRGSSILSSLRLDSGDSVLAHMPSHHDHAVGERIGIRADLEDVIVFPATAEPEVCALRIDRLKISSLITAIHCPTIGEHLCTKHPPAFSPHAVLRSKLKKYNNFQKFSV